MSTKILVIPGDGIGPEITAQAVKIIELLQKEGLAIEYEFGVLGGSAYEQYGHPFPEATRLQAQQADAILLGAVGHPQYENLARKLRPERGLLAIRQCFDLFTNLRPIRIFPCLINNSPLKESISEHMDMLIVRELTGDIYFGKPRGFMSGDQGEKIGFNTMRYSEAEIRRIAQMAFGIAKNRHKKLTSVDKANVLETTELWRQTVNEVSQEYPDVAVNHLYIDNTAMQMVLCPTQFDVLLTGNLFGDILSDLGAALTGSIGLLPSASLNEQGKGLYEPAHGSAPDIAGTDKANPLATLLSLALLLRHSLHEHQLANCLENAINEVLQSGKRTVDIHTLGTEKISCSAMGTMVRDSMCLHLDNC